ncbi:MAG TPA: hypothetical protein VF897_12230, partial [Roseiflexaceae bacterium]
PAASDADAVALPLAVVRGAVGLLVAALAAANLFLRSRRARVGRAPALGIPWLALACLVVALVAVDARWAQLTRVRYEFLLPDAQGYRAIAAEFPQKMAHYRAQNYSALLDAVYAAGFDGRASAPAVFYAGGNNGREPLWPATERVVFDLLGVSAFHARVTSLLLGVIGAALTCWFSWRALHPLVGVTAGLLAATNWPLVVNSVAGLREELVSVLFTVGVAALFVSARRGAPPSWSRVALAGVSMGGVVLDRADMVVLAGGMTTLAALALRWPWRRWLAACAIIGALAGPMYAGYAFTHHDPFYPGTYGATVNRNLEFPERMGTPGFPSPEEYAANWAAGPTISPLKYFFGYHTVPQFVDYTLRGFWRIFTDILFVDWQKPVLWLFVAGMVLLVVTRRWLIPFLVVAALMPFYAFLAGVPNPWVFAPRYAHHAFPYAAMAAAYAAWFIPIWLGKNWSALTPWQEK